jgi:hypothetical protein
VNRWNDAGGSISRGLGLSRSSGVVSRGVGSPAGESDQHFFSSLFFPLSIRELQVQPRKEPTSISPRRDSYFISKRHSEIPLRAIYAARRR